MRGFFAFIPGLRSVEQVTEGEQLDANGAPLPGTTARAVYDAATAHKLRFEQINVQTPENPNPTLTEMGAIAAARILQLQLASGSCGHLCMSSVGAGTGLQALSNRIVLPPNSVVMYEGVYDPLSLIPMQAASIPGGADALAAVQNGNAPFFPLPVETPEPTKPRGHFRLEQRHMNDPLAIRAMNPTNTHQIRLREAFSGRRIETLDVVTKADLRLSPPHLAQQFAQHVGPVIANKTSVHIVDGGHGNGQHDAFKTFLDQHLGQFEV